MPIRIILAKKYGFCFGVKRAVSAAAKLGRPAYTLGPIIHNKHVVNLLAKKGVVPIKSISRLKTGVFIIRAHGVSDRLIDQAKKKNLKVIDLTCPYVKKNQFLAKKLEKDNYQVIIIGDRNHPEIRAIASNLKKPIIIKDSKEINKINNLNQVGIICQTTFNLETANRIIKKLRKRTKTIKVFDTICEATKQRQRAADTLSQKVNLMIIIGGRHSSNTNKLREICQKNVITHHIESPVELKAEWFINTKKVGITAGASTPDWLIKTIIKKIRTMR